MRLMEERKIDGRMEEIRRDENIGGREDGEEKEEEIRRDENIGGREEQKKTRGKGRKKNRKSIV